MNRRNCLQAGAASLSALAGFRVARAQERLPHFAMGARAGEITSTTALLHTRLTQFPAALDDGAVPGMAGEVCWEWSADPLLDEVRRTDWAPVDPAGDFIHQHELTGLPAGQPCYYRPVARGAGREERPGRIQKLQTAPLPDDSRSLGLIIFGCQKWMARESELGHAAYEPAMALDPDFAVWTGDNVYYDNDALPRGVDETTCRHHWHRQYALHRQRLFCARSGGYWQKDDHDYRFDDADPFTAPERDPSHHLGVRLFREQNPVRQPTYRTFRWGKGLQVWLLEGRDYRGRNSFPDGPGKSIWGFEQRAWLQAGLKSSDALFKLVISPTPLIGPDRASKRDNHSNAGGYQWERDRFFDWLRDNSVRNVYFCNGDRHWQYHSRHRSGFQEFGAASLNAAILQAVPPLIPGVERPYGRSVAGFLRVRILCTGPDADLPVIAFDHYDWRGEPQNSHFERLQV